MAASMSPNVIVSGVGMIGIGSSPVCRFGLADMCRLPGSSRYFTLRERQVWTVVRVVHRAYSLSMPRLHPVENHSISATERTTVVLANDHRGLRRRLRWLLDCADDLDVVGEANDFESALHEVTAEHPDVLVLDLRMPHGFSAKRIQELRRLSPGTGIVVTTMHLDESFANEALRAGAIGFVLADTADRELLDAVRRAGHGLPFTSPRVRRAVA